jgi:hypothetical protein
MIFLKEGNVIYLNIFSECEVFGFERKGILEFWFEFFSIRL